MLTFMHHIAMPLSCTYYMRRLLAFFFVNVLYEFIEVSILSLTGVSGELSDISGIISLCGETMASFVFCVLPFLLYLAALPSAFHGGRSDRLITQCLFVLFCIVNAMEELAEVLSGDSFDLLSSTLILNPQKALCDLMALPCAEVGIPIAVAVVLLSVLLFRRHLMAGLPAPSFGHRVLIGFSLVCIGFVLLYATDGIEAGQDMPPVFEDGMISLFGGIFQLTKIPPLTSIFAPPCLALFAAMGIMVLFDAIARQLGAGRFAPSALLQRLQITLPARYDRLTLCLLGGVLLILFLRVASLGLYPLMDPTEARYAEMARKMIETGNWLQPQFDYGVPFWGKPPLSFQASALTMLLFGVNEFGARFAPFLCMVLMALCFFLWPFSGEHPRRQALSCAFVMFCSAIGFVAAGAVMTDAFLSLGITLAMVSFHRALTEEAQAKRWGYLFFLGLVIGLLSKGPLTLVLCGLPLFLRVLLRGEWRLLWRKLPWVGGSLMLLLLVVPWYAAAEHATPGFLRYFIIGEHVERFLVKGWQGDLYGAGHARALGTIWLYAVEMFLPWVLLLPFLLRRRACSGEQSGAALHLVLWGLSPLVFFTVARNVLPAYVLPALPAWCLLLVRELELRAARRPAMRYLVLSPMPLLLLMLLFLLGSGSRHLEDVRCDRDLMRLRKGEQVVFYAGQKPSYSGQFYSGGNVRRYDGDPALLPAGSLLVTEVKDAAPGEVWQQLESNYRHCLWEKTGEQAPQARQEQP